MYLVINSWLEFSLQQMTSTNIGQIILPNESWIKKLWISSSIIFNNNYIFSSHNVIVIFLFLCSSLSINIQKREGKRIFTISSTGKDLNKIRYDYD